jgi:hypothetical protein
MEIKYNKLTPDDLPIVICAISGRPTPKRDAIFQDGHWVRREFADEKRRNIESKEEL